MVDLTSSAGFLKRFAIWIVLCIVGLILIIVFYLNRSMIGSALFPAKPLPATIAFGILPKFDLNFGYRPTGNILYNLQTVSGDLPNFPTTAKVFAISQNKASFSAPETIKQTIWILILNRKLSEAK